MLDRVSRAKNIQFAIQARDLASLENWGMCFRTVQISSKIQTTVVGPKANKKEGENGYRTYMLFTELKLGRETQYSCSLLLNR